jgi:hypothetical protein
MKTNLIAIATDYTKNCGWKVTPTMTYPVICLKYDKDWPEGRVTIVDDSGSLVRISTECFKFKTV